MKLQAIEEKIARLRRCHTAYCESGDWVKAQSIRARIIEAWDTYHGQQELNAMRQASRDEKWMEQQLYNEH